MINATSERYGNYKNSGNKWIGEIPSHWKIGRIKDELSSLDHKRIPLNGDVRGNMTNPQFDYYGASGIIDKVDDYIFDESLLLIGEDGANLLMRNSPLAFIAKGKYWVNNHAHVLKPRNGNLEFYCYLLESFDYTILISGSAQPKLTAGELKNVFLMLPPFAEQQGIAAYLDEQTAVIDQKISLLTQKAARYKELKQALINETVTRGLETAVCMKDSGIEWLGKIPAHWKVRRVKDELSSFDHKRIPLSGEARGNMANPQFDYYGASGIIDKVDDFIFDEPLILIGEDGANLLMQNSPLAFIARGKYWVNNHAHVLKPRKGNLEFFCYLLESFDYTILISGAAQPKLTAGELKNVFLMIPPLSEQKAIADYLDTKTAHIDRIAETIHSQIEHLQELRKTLINDVVTGKIKVIDG